MRATIDSPGASPTGSTPMPMQKRELLQIIGGAALQAPTRDAAAALLDSFALSYDQFHDLAVYRDGGSLVRRDRPPQTESLARQPRGPPGGQS